MPGVISSPSNTLVVHAVSAPVRVKRHNIRRDNPKLCPTGMRRQAHAFLEEADTTFSKFDLNDDGQLSWAEVDKFTRRPDAFGGGSDADLFMALVDTNQSETVYRAEWHTFLLGIWNKHGPEAAKGFLAMLQMSFDIPE